MILRRGGSRRRAQAGGLYAALVDRLTRTLGKTPDQATPRDIYDALSLAVREELTLRWLSTQRRVADATCQARVLSLGRIPARPSLLNALHSLDGDLVHEARATLKEMGHEFEDIEAQEPDPGLGNGGLGPARRLFPRFDGDASLPGDRVRHSLRLWDLHPGDRGGRRPARDREQLAQAPECVGDAARQRALHGAIRRAERGRRFREGHRRASMGGDGGHLRHRLRPVDPGQPQSDRQSPAPLVGPRHHAVSHRGVQRGRLHRRRARTNRRQEPVAGPLPRRFHPAGQGAAPEAAVLLRERELCRTFSRTISARAERSSPCPTRSPSS